MLNSSIWKKNELQRVLTDYGIDTLYAKPEFCFDQQIPEFCFYSKTTKPVSALHIELQRIFGMCVIRVASGPTEPACALNLRTIWYKGRWYI